MAKVIDVSAAAALVESGMTVMVGGFMGCGSPHGLIDYMSVLDRNDMTLICNDAGFPDYGVGRMVNAGQFSRLLVSHIGLNPQCGKMMNEGTIQVDLIPQGTLAERIRHGGAGLGGFLTPTGVGTMVAADKKVIEIEGKNICLKNRLPQPRS